MSDEGDDKTEADRSREERRNELRAVYEEQVLTGQSWCRYLIEGYKTTMDDGWRNDFADDGQAEDALRFENLIRDIALELGVEEAEAEQIYDWYNDSR